MTGPESTFSKDTFNRDTLLDRRTWLRGLLMVLFYVIYKIAEFGLIVIAVLQFVATLINGRPSDSLKRFGASVSRLFYDIMLYLTFNSDERPFPFSGWPEAQAPAAQTRRPA